MSVIAKREAIKQVYPTKTWAAKVNKMPETQVTAIYLKMKREGKI